MVTVNFPLLGKSVKIDANAKISDACEKVGKPLNLVCAGKGKCKKCAVDIQIDGKVETVLGCQTQVSDGINVMITSEEVEAKILTSNMLKDITPNPSLKAYYLSREELQTPLCENDWETIKNALRRDLNPPSIHILRKLSTVFHHPNGIYLILYNDDVIDVLPGDESDVIYGLAYDIGSTSVVGYLYNMINFQQIGISSRLNKQTSIGGDVISRIEYTISNPNGLERLNSLVIDTVNEIIDDICSEHGIEPNKIYHANFCGNSTIQHLFLGLHPEHLGLSPFTSTTHDIVTLSAKDAKVKINPNGVVTFLPLLGGFVGADTSAVLLSLENDNKDRLIIDLGTNGEIAVGKNSEYKVSSTACGPALEGAGLEFGMRGTKGAIEKIKIIDGDVHYEVIGNAKPQGICGSGIIDAIAELLRANLINKRGGFVNPSKVEEPNLAKRFTTFNDQKAFIIAFKEETENGKDILITQKDVRQVQLAKAAIFTGCNMLIDECGLKGEDLEEILIAGAFGNYIDIHNAQYIGMIPNFEGVSVRSIGNAAATGSQMFLLSQDKQLECEKLAKNAIHVEIATNPSFVNNYLLNTYFEKR